MLRLLASLEKASEHPLAGAIVAGANERHLQLTKDGQFPFRHRQKARSCRYSRRRSVTVSGSAKLLEELSIDPQPLISRAGELRLQGQTVMLVAIDGRPAGIVGVADPFKAIYPGSDSAPATGEGLRLVMLTGDNRITAQAVASKLGINDVQADVLPDKKAEVVKQLQSQGYIVCRHGR